MLVYCFLVNVFNRRHITTPDRSAEKILLRDIILQSFAKELGDDIPNYVSFLGLSDVYAFVVDSNIDVVRLCKIYNYDLCNLCKKEISDDCYNKNHTISISYSRISNHPTFELIKDDDI